MAAGIGLSVEQKGLRELGLLIKAEADGKILRKELQVALKEAVAPAVQEVKAGAMVGQRSMSFATKFHAPMRESAVSIGASIARGVSTQVRLSGRTTGVSVKASKKGMPRKFRNAPKRFNEPSFRHKVFGRDVWVEQIGAPGFFDRPLWARKAQYRAACVAVMETMAARLASRSA